MTGLVEATAAQIKAFRDTKGLIIDVRENGGGNYGMMCGSLRFLRAGRRRAHTSPISPHIGLSPQLQPGTTSNTGRRIEPIGQVGMTQERAAIRQAAAAFRPEWPLPQGKFSEWHYMILSRRAERSRRSCSDDAPTGQSRHGLFLLQQTGGRYIERRVRSAPADGFLNAFAALPQVTIVGEPSAGGSGATRQFQLPRTRCDRCFVIDGLVPAEWKAL